jgi:hypothetical protein
MNWATDCQPQDELELEKIHFSLVYLTSAVTFHFTSISAYFLLYFNPTCTCTYYFNELTFRSSCSTPNLTLNLYYFSLKFQLAVQLIYIQSGQVYSLYALHTHTHTLSLSLSLSLCRSPRNITASVCLRTDNFLLTHKSQRVPALE